MVDQDTAPKELFYTEGTPALREARLQACCPSPTLPGPLPCMCRKYLYRNTWSCVWWSLVGCSHAPSECSDMSLSTCDQSDVVRQFVQVA